MNYTEAVEYIHSLLKFGVRPGLSGMDALLSYLGNPHKDLKFIHVAGTNGKGSVSTALSNILIEAGYKTGLYTSPFVSHFLERVQFCGKPVDEEVFSKSVEKVKKGVELLSDNGVVITEFEALTAGAFLCFKELSCQVVVLEVGLGGRLDATNVIEKPLVNVITSLSLDHTAILGETIEEIAFEKCGTIKKDGNIVSSFGQPEKALKVIKESAEKNNCCLTVVDDNDVKLLKSDVFGVEFIYKNETYKASLSGMHQVKNMTAVIEACEYLKTYFHIEKDNIKKGIFETVLPARVEVLCKNPLIILDGGHNEDGARAFFETVKNELAHKDNVFVVAGMMGDKAVEESLKPLMKHTDNFVCVTPENPRAMKAEELYTIAHKYCNNTEVIDNPVDGVDFVFSRLKANDVLCCVGSLYLAGEIREHLIKKINEFIDLKR